MTEAGSKSAERFEPHRRYLLGLAYRMLGSLAEAEDAVQDAYLRWHMLGDGAQVEKPRAFLGRTVTRLCLDRLKSARARREIYVGPWLPEPVLDEAALVPDTEASDIAHDLSVALMLTLQRLSPLERAAFILHEIFEAPFGEIAATLQRSEASCRQLAARARAHLKAERPRFTVSETDQSRLTAAFIAAAHDNDRAALARLFAEDIVFISDGGGKATAVNRPLRGAWPVAKLMAGLARQLARHPGVTLRPARINGLPGLIVAGAEGVIQTMALEPDKQGRVAAIYVIRNPEKLRRVN